jgi:hypothetical protein
LKTLAFAILALLTTVATAEAQGFRTCDIHNGMKIWFVDMDNNNKPIGVRQGTVDINEATWQKKCKSDRMGEKVYVPFNFVNAAGKADYDTRWPFNVYRNRAEAQRNFYTPLGAQPR